MLPFKLVNSLLDIAGVAYGDSSASYKPKGATGVPVCTLVNLAVRLAGS